MVSVPWYKLLFMVWLGNLERVHLLYPLVYLDRRAVKDVEHIQVWIVPLLHFLESCLFVLFMRGSC